MISEIEPTTLAALRQSGESIYLVDVRQPWEHEAAALSGSKLVPLGELPQRLSEIQPPEGALVVVYCHHGIRSLRGAALLHQAGFARVASLAGGIDAWSLEVDPRVPRY